MSAPGTVLARHAVGHGGQLLTVAVPPAHAAAYATPGQYCELEVGGVAGYFAIARAPGPGPLEFYIRDAGGASTGLLAAPIGAAVAVGRPAGAGFDLAALADRAPRVVVATGSGYGAVRGLLQVVPITALYVGARTAGHLAFGDELAALAAAGVAVTVAFSRDPEGAPPPGARRFDGYVQDAIAADAPALAEGAVVACGQDAMQVALRGIAGGLGLPATAFVTNY